MKDISITQILAFAGFAISLLSLLLQLHLGGLLAAFVLGCATGAVLLCAFRRLSP
jgi:hypothetical protein